MVSFCRANKLWFTSEGRLLLSTPYSVKCGFGLPLTAAILRTARKYFNFLPEKEKQKWYLLISDDFYKYA